MTKQRRSFITLICWMMIFSQNISNAYAEPVFFSWPRVGFGDNELVQESPILRIFSEGDIRGILAFGAIVAVNAAAARFATVISENPKYETLTFSLTCTVVLAIAGLCGIGKLNTRPMMAATGTELLAHLQNLEMDQGGVGSIRKKDLREFYATAANRLGTEICANRHVPMRYIHGSAQFEVHYGSLTAVPRQVAIDSPNHVHHHEETEGIRSRSKQVYPAGPTIRAEHVRLFNKIGRILKSPPTVYPHTIVKRVACDPNSPPISEAEELTLVKVDGTPITPTFLEAGTHSILYPFWYSNDGTNYRAHLGGERHFPFPGWYHPAIHVSPGGQAPIPTPIPAGRYLARNPIWYSLNGIDFILLQAGEHSFLTPGLSYPAS